MMHYRLSNIIYGFHRNFVINGTRRYAGHSKWQNIKHIKEEKDAEKARMIRMMIGKMTVAITEGGSADPAINNKLASLIQQAKKMNVPLSTVNGFLDKMKNPKPKAETQVLTVRTSSRCILLLYYATNNKVRLIANLNSICKKNSAIVAEEAIGIFDCISYIVAEKNCDFDEATLDAIEIGAEDVEELKENNETHYKFNCEFLQTKKVESQLIKRDYCIQLIEDTSTPKSMVELNKEQLERINKIKSKFLELEDIIKIEDNIAQS